MISEVNCMSFDDAIKKIEATQLQYDDLQGDWNLEAVKRFISNKMKEEAQDGTTDA